ncbi:20503_t:CDS:1, partial [Dentiscutata erythropus]
KHEYASPKRWLSHASFAASHHVHLCERDYASPCSDIKMWVFSTISLIKPRTKG